MTTDAILENCNFLSLPSLEANTCPAGTALCLGELSEPWHCSSKAKFSFCIYFPAAAWSRLVWWGGRWGSCGLTGGGHQAVGDRHLLPAQGFWGAQTLPVPCPAPVGRAQCLQTGQEMQWVGLMDLWGFERKLCCWPLILLSSRPEVESALM